MTTPDQALTREQFIEKLANCVDHRWTGDEDVLLLQAHDAALREQLNQAMQTQEQLAANVNMGLLENRALRARITELEAVVARLDDMADVTGLNKTTIDTAKYFSCYLTEKLTKAEAEIVRLKSVEQERDALNSVMPIAPDYVILNSQLQARVAELEQQLARDHREWADHAVAEAQRFEQGKLKEWES